jgi:hypothetical protein
VTLKSTDAVEHAFGAEVDSGSIVKTFSIPILRSSVDIPRQK